MKRTLIASLLAALVVPAALARDDASNAEVILTIGDKTITAQRVNQQIRKLGQPTSPEQQNPIRQKVIQEMIYMALLESYLDQKDVPFTDADLAEIRNRLKQTAQKQGITVDQLMERVGFTQKDLETQARQWHLLQETTSDAKAKAYVEKHPHYFDGTEVSASHILIKCHPLAPTAEQQQAVETLRKLKADIQAGRTTFEDAAAEHSSCPSKKQGGKLGSFSFTKMVPPFAVAAFATPTGELADVVRTRFGFHLIRVDDRQEESGKPQPNSLDLAKRVMVALLQNELYDQALEASPIVVGSTRTADASDPPADKDESTGSADTRPGGKD